MIDITIWYALIYILNRKIADINANHEATLEEREAAIKLVNQTITTANDNILAACLTTGIGEISKIASNPLSLAWSTSLFDMPWNTYRANAITAINRAVAKQREQIDENHEATQEERNTALNELDLYFESLVQKPD
jgi:hypothetical protein